MDKPITSITPPSRFSFGLKELWQYRELFYFFTWRDIKVKYKQTSLGILWAILQPLAMMLLFTFLFSRNLDIDTGSVSYQIFVLAGLICWNLFNSAVSHAGESMIQNANIITKIYFPRLIIPCSSTLAALFDFIIGLIIFIVFCVLYKQPISWAAIVYFPAAILLILLISIGAGTFLAALNIKYRDFRYTIPFLLQVLFFASQIIYPVHLIKSEILRYVLSINPINAVLELFRAPLYGVSPDMNVVSIGVIVTLFIFFIGLFYFKKTEAYFADIA